MIKRALTGKDHPVKAAIHKKHNVAHKAMRKEGNAIRAIIRGDDWGKSRLSHKKVSKKKDWFLS